MKEYKIKSINDEAGNEIYLLEPIVAEDKPHYIQFDSLDEAHQGKLSLGLGKIADPLKSPELYRVLGHLYEEKKVYKFLVKDVQPDESEDINSCCFSGCTGCPTYAKKMGLE